jgi:hypothetical protein
MMVLYLLLNMVTASTHMRLTYVVIIQLRLWKDNERLLVIHDKIIKKRI